MQPVLDESDPQTQLQIGLSLMQPIQTPDGWRGWLEPLLPHAYARESSPVFAYEMRDIARNRTRRDLLRGTAFGLLRDVIFALVLWGIAFASNQGITRFERYDRLWLLLGLALGLGIVASVALDGFIVFITAFNSRHETESGVGQDLLRLSWINTAEQVRARYAAGQIRAWNILRTVLGLRVIVIVFLLLNLLISVLFPADFDLRGYFSFRFDDQFGFVPGALTEVLALLMVIFLAGLLLIEPLWRLRALVAAGMAAAGGRRPTMPVVIRCLAALAGLWLIQIMLATTALVLIFLVVGGSAVCLALMLPGSVLLVGGGLRMLYYGATLAWLQSAYRHALIEE